MNESPNTPDLLWKRLEAEEQGSDDPSSSHEDSAELDRLVEVWRMLDEPAVTDPASDAGQRFRNALDVEVRRIRRSVARQRRRNASLVGLAAAIAMLVAALFLVEWRDVAPEPRWTTDCGDLRAGIDSRDTLDRLQAALCVADEGPTAIQLESLLHLLRTDPNGNVRLAALATLERRVDAREVRRGIARAFAAEPALTVRFAMLQVVLDHGIAEALPAIRSWLEEDDLDPWVRRTVGSELGRLDRGERG